MQTLQIKIPEGYQVDTFNEKTGEVSFKEKPKNVMERIKTLEDVLTDHDLTKQKVDLMFEGVPTHLKYQYIAELLCKSLNEGWEPDWDNGKYDKYYPWFYLGGSSGFRFDGYDGWYSGSDVGSRLCLKSSELAEYAGKQFTDIYKQFMIINN